jgi:membrane-associated PAP2 superfamily phosphatase
MRRSRAWLCDGLIPILLLVGLTVPFWTTSLDLDIARAFYAPGEGWPRGSEQPWHALKHQGVSPAWVLVAAALGVFTSSFWSARARPHRRAALFLVLVMAVGPGLIVNDVFKKNWGRPRPKDVFEFGGDRAYVRPWIKSPRENGGSFASGHAATAFYLLTPYFLFRKRRRAVAAGFLALGIGYGCLMGCARTMQGAHFASDVVWALGFVYLSGALLYHALRLDRPPPDV